MHRINKIKYFIPVILLLSFIPIVQGITFISAITDTFHYTDGFSFTLKFPVKDQYNFVEFLIRQIILLARDIFGYAEHVIPFNSQFVIAMINDGFKYFSGNCTICQIIITNTITQIISNTQTGTNTLQATDTPTNSVITQIILPMIIIFVVIGLVAIKFPLAGLSLMLTFGVLTFIYLAYLQILPSYILVIVAVIGAACLALIINRLIGSEQHG